MDLHGHFLHVFNFLGRDFFKNILTLAHEVAMTGSGLIQHPPHSPPKTIFPVSKDFDRNR